MDGTPETTPVQLDIVLPASCYVAIEILQTVNGFVILADKEPWKIANDTTELRTAVNELLTRLLDDNVPTDKTDKQNTDSKQDELNPTSERS